MSDALAARSDSGSLVARLGPLAHPSQSTTYQPMMRGLCLAIVDEADSLLVDEARIPLVLSAAQQAHSVTDTEAAIALGLAEQLLESVDYRVMPTSRFVELTEAGRDELQRLSLRVSACWKSTRYRDERVGQALSVIHRFRRDRDYIVREGRLELLDAHTGRAMPERRLQQGLHRLLELKERCALTPDHEIVASIPVQHFFRRYLALVGLSGTLREVRGEIHRVYDSHMVYVQTHRPSARTVLPARVFADRASQLQALVDELHRRSDIGQPVLVCTRSVEQSSGVSAMLTAHGMDHRVLNAYQDAEEAAIVARAGQQKQITVATSMAGRGTDIEPGPGVVGLGGLHVISLAFNDARRLDRQLAGHAARQGDPGSCQQLHCLDDPFLVDALPAFWRGIALRCVRNHWQRLALQLIRLTQHRRW